MDILSDLEARGLIHDTTDRDALAARLSSGPIVLYCGFDPTADSLHVGNLIGLLTLRRFQLAGHLPISLAGGATGMVGDPSGRDAERNLLDDDGLAKNLEGILPQLRMFLEFEGESAAKLLDNRLDRRRQRLGILKGYRKARHRQPNGRQRFSEKVECRREMASPTQNSATCSCRAMTTCGSPKTRNANFKLEAQINGATSCWEQISYVESSDKQRMPLLGHC